MKNKLAFYILSVLLLANMPSFALAEEADDFQVAGFELEKLLNLGSGLLAAGLFIATLFAYKRTKNKRLIYVSAAFFLFAVKGLLTSHELFFEELSGIDPIASALNFAIILSFFFGIMNK